MPASETIIPIVEEEVDITKRTVGTGRVRVETTTDFVEELVKAGLESSDVEVSRVPVGRIVEEAPQMRTEGDVIVVPVLEEVLVVEKRLVLKEEVRIERRVTTDAVEVPVTLRKQRAVITRSKDGETPESYEEQDNG